MRTSHQTRRRIIVMRASPSAIKRDSCCQRLHYPPVLARKDVRPVAAPVDQASRVVRADDRRHDAHDRRYVDGRAQQLDQAHQGRRKAVNDLGAQREARDATSCNGSETDGADLVP